MSTRALVGNLAVKETNSAEDIPSPRWAERLHALKNIPPVMKYVWDAAPGVAVANLVSRVVAALIPLSMLAVTRLIIAEIYALNAQQTPLPHHFWWLVTLEFALAGVAAILMRVTDFCDTALAERFMKHISVRLMKHAANLDLMSYEDPVFYDKLERARVQSTDRVQMIKISGRLIQETITTVSLAAGIFVYSPWLLIALVACVVPAFLGETHFAFLGYSLSFQQTPARRELDYLRLLGGTKEGAKELKLFGLAPFLVGRYSDVATELHDQTIGVARHRLFIGSLLAMVGVAGYYGTYAFVIYHTVIGLISLATMIFLAGAIGGASSNIQAVFTTFSEIANQALFMTDLLEFFAVKPRIFSKPGALPAPKKIQQGFEFRNVSFAYPGSSRIILKNVSFKLAPSERIAIVDFDVHHGNGTQAMTASRPGWLYASTHQYPFYPGTGSVRERGPYGNIVNAPLASGDGSAEFRAVFDEVILPALSFVSAAHCVPHSPQPPSVSTNRTPALMESPVFATCH